MDDNKKAMLLYGLAGLGNVTGIIVAVKRKSGFLAGAGWFVLGGLAGAAIGYIAVSMIPDKQEKGKGSLSLDTKDGSLDILIKG